MRGFAAPEQCIDPSAMIQEMKNRGFFFREIEEKTRT
jgi:hypothetical protein